MPFRPPVHPTHAREAPAPRPSPSRVYDRAWQRLRLSTIADQPLCRFCLDEGVMTPTDEIDHIVPVAQRPDLRLDPSNLRGLCKSHHSRHTALSRCHPGTPVAPPHKPFDRDAFLRQ